MGLFTLALGAFILFLLFVALVLYLLEAYAVYSIASKKGLNTAWLSWIPGGGAQIVICLMTEQQAPKFVRGKLFLVYLITLLLTIVTSFSGSDNGFMIFVGSVCSILLAVIQYMTFYYLVSQYSDSAVAHLVIAILTLGLSMIISLYMIKNRERIDGTQEGNETPLYSTSSNDNHEDESKVKTEIPKMPEFKEESEIVEQRDPKKPHIVEAPEITKIEEEIEDSKKKSIVIDKNIPEAPRTPSEGPAPEEDVEQVSIDGLPKFESNTDKSDSKNESILDKESKNKLNLEKDEEKPPL